MFGYVTASYQELNKAEQLRYSAVYCGICRQLRADRGQLARLWLSYDMAFLALLLMSLYEPEEHSGSDHCMLHPIQKKNWVDNEFVRYAADMNIVLACYKALDDWNDEKKPTARLLYRDLAAYLPPIEAKYPRQCESIREALEELGRLERENCPNPDEPAACFGRLMGSLLTCRQDLWADTLQQMGYALGRFIYLTDAVLDYPQDRRHGSYNPLIAMGGEPDPDRWENYLVLAMARCTEYYERLPLVQDKGLLDNILYSGVWGSYRRKRKEGATHDRGSL